MRFLFSIMALASIAGALIALYAGAGSFLKLNQSSDQEKALAAQRASAMLNRMAQHNGTLAKLKLNGNSAFSSLNLNPWGLSPIPGQSASDPSESEPSPQTDASPVHGNESKSSTAAVPHLSFIPPALWDLAASRILSATAPAPPRVIPRRTPTPAEEALSAYRKYATPQ
jgi:hypothetical protein